MTRRRKHRRPRRSKSRPVKRRGNPWLPLITLVTLTIVGFLIYKFVFWAISTEYFSVKEITIAGLRYIKENEIQAELKDALGTNIFRLKISEMEEKLASLPWVKEVRIYRALPSNLHVDVFERELLALLNTGSGLIAVDCEGELVAPPRTGEIYDLPLITGCSTGEENFLQAVNFLRAGRTLCPRVFAAISEVTFPGADRALHALVAEGAKPVLIGKGSHPEKVFKLWLLIYHPEMKFSDYSNMDLRFPGKVFFTRS